MKGGDALWRWLRHWPQPLQFILVGAVAAGTHLGVVVILVQGLGLSPLLANVPAFCLAFGVSYNGHARLTFGRSGARGPAVAGRYFLVASLSLLLNELLYAWALHGLGWPYVWALLLVLLLVAVLTFVLSKYWAFARQRGGP